MVYVKASPFQLSARLQYALRQLWWQGSLGLLLILLSIVYLFVVIAPARNTLLEQQIAAVKTQKEIKQSRLNSKVQATSSEEQLSFLLPTKDKMNAQISMILNLAAQSGLQVDKVAYAQSLDHHLLQLQMKLPIEGRYVQIRQFIHDVLNTIPTIALHDMSLKRDDISAVNLNAQIELTIFFKDGID